MIAALHRCLPALEAAVEELKRTWPKLGDEGMASLQDAGTGLSERDRSAAGGQRNS